MKNSFRLPTNRTTHLHLENLEGRTLLATFTVDDDFAADVPAQNRYNTIQEAVDAASAGDTIKVKAGTYEENVLVDKQLTILGANPRLSSALDATKASIVDPVDNGAAGSPAFGFNLQANDIAIKGFTIGELDAATDADGTVGINTSVSFSGYTIANNVIQNNTFGISLNTSTDAGAQLTRVSHNVIRDNNAGFGVQAASGNGIYSDQGARNVRIAANTFSGQQNEDVIFVAPTAPQTNINVQHNALNDSSGIFFINVANSKIQGNVVQKSFANAIELAGGNEDVVVRNNKLVDVGTDGYNGIFLHDNFAVGENSGIRIQNNTITGAGLSGIVIRASSNNTIRGNHVTGSVGFDLSDPTWGNGISLEGATNNTVAHNTLRDNAASGIRADADSVDNFFTNNYAKGNDVFDYNDLSTGSGTAGTGNTWKHNRGATQNVNGLIWRFV